MTTRSVCTARVEGVGRCDLKAGHYPATLHLLVNPADDADGEWSKTIWPFGEDDIDVQRYLAVAQAYEDEDNRRMAVRGQE